MEIVAYFRFILALDFVIALIAGIAWLMRRHGVGGRIVTARKGRLSIVEVAPLAARRRAVLLRRDNVEHLLVLGPTHETVVESHIRSDSGDRTAAEERDWSARREGTA